MFLVLEASSVTETVSNISASPQAATLYAALEVDGVSHLGREAWTLARYNPPYTLPWFRTNEIHVPLQVHDSGDK